MQSLHLVRVNVALSNFNFSKRASCQIAAEHLKLGRKLFLRQMIFFSDPCKMCAKPFCVFKIQAQHLLH